MPVKSLPTVIPVLRDISSRNKTPTPPPFNLQNLDVKPFSEMPLTDIYLVDSHLVIGYMKEDIPGWKAWADTYIALGKKFLLLEQVVKEVSVKHDELPPGFEPLRVFWINFS